MRWAPVRSGSEWKWAAAAAFLFMLAVSALKLCQHFALQTQAYDLGIYANVVWNTARGRFFEDAVKGVHYLGDHFSPGLAVLAPLFWIWESAACLLVAQTAALAAAIPAIFRLARRVLGAPRAALGFAVWFALFPYLHRVSASDFHAVAMAVPFLAWALCFWEENREKEMLLCLAGAMLWQEDVALVAAGIGVYIAVAAKQRARRVGLWIAGVSAAVFLLEVFALMPSFGGSWRPGHWRFYADLGEGPMEMFLALADPWTWWRLLSNPQKAASACRLFAYAAGLCFLAPRALIVLLIPFTYNILSGRAAQFQFDAHYSATLLAPLFFAMIHGYKRLSARWRAAPALFLAMPLAGLSHAPRYFDTAGLERRVAMREIREIIPPDAAVQASMNVVPHLCLRREISVLPGPRAAPWIVLDLEQVGWDMPPAYKRGAADFVARRRGELVFEKKGLLVFGPAR